MCFRKTSLAVPSHIHSCSLHILGVLLVPWACSALQWLLSWSDQLCFIFQSQAVLSGIRNAPSSLLWFHVTIYFAFVFLLVKTVSRWTHVCLWICSCGLLYFLKFYIYLLSVGGHVEVRQLVTVRLLLRCGSLGIELRESCLAANTFAWQAFWSPPTGCFLAWVKVHDPVLNRDRRTCWPSHSTQELAAILASQLPSLSGTWVTSFCLMAQSDVMYSTL